MSPGKAQHQAVLTSVVQGAQDMIQNGIDALGSYAYPGAPPGGSAFLGQNRPIIWEFPDEETRDLVGRTFGGFEHVESVPRLLTVRSKSGGFHVPVCWYG